MWLHWLRWIHRSLFFLLLGLILLSYLGPWSLWCNMLVHFRLQYSILLLLSALAFWFLSEKRLIWLAVAVGLSQAIPVSKAWIPNSSPDSAPSETLEVISWNVLKENDQYGEAVDYLVEKEPELLILLETTQAWDQALEPIWSRYPYQKRIPKENFFGIMVLSKWPLEKVQVHQLVEADVPIITAQVTKEGRSFHLLALHVPSPPLTQEILWRNEIFGNLPALRKELGDPFLLIGDINTTPYSTQFRQLLADMNLADSRRGFGPQGTWKARLGWFGIPLDHALHSNNLKILQREVGPYLGSDHRPIELQLSW